MTYHKIVKKYSKELVEVTHIPQKEVEIMLLCILGKNPIWLHMNYHEECFCEEELRKNVIKRKSYYPLEYITGRVNFYGEEFFIEPNILIPRPETEILVENTIEFITKVNKPLKVLEIGVGSGIISIMLAKNCKNITIKAVDINNDALQLAKKNSILHHVHDKIELIKSNLFEMIEQENFDIIISNPPYIKNEYNLPKNVQYEPKNALFGGINGDEILIKIIEKTYEKRIPYLFCEIGYDQKEKLYKVLTAYKPKKIEFYKDLEKFDRGFMVEFHYENG